MKQRCLTVLKVSDYFGKHAGKENLKMKKQYKKILVWEREERDRERRGIGSVILVGREYSFKISFQSLINCIKALSNYLSQIQMDERTGLLTSCKYLFTKK